MGKTIAVANQKGGVGKTTTAVNLSACLATDERRTLLVDLDPQANATSGFEAGVESLDGSVYEVLLGHAPLAGVICSVAIPLLELVPSHISLAGAEVEMAAILGRERRLAEALEEVRDDYEFIVAFEADDPADFLDLVMELRGTEASKYTRLETPIFTGIARPVTVAASLSRRRRAAEGRIHQCSQSVTPNSE